MGIFNNIFSVKKNKDYKLSKANSKSLKKDNYNRNLKKVDDGQYEKVDYSDNGYDFVDGFIRNFDTDAIKKTYDRYDATFLNGAVAVWEGFTQFGEALLDTGATVTSTIGTVLWDGSGYLLDAVGLDEAAEVAHGYAEEERRVLQDFVAEERTKNSFDVIYNETNFGKWVMDNSYGAETVRSFGNGVGYTIGALVCCYVTCGAISPVALGVTGGVGGVGKGTQEAWSNGASYGEGLAYGGATGAWEGLQFWAGGKINTLSPFEKTLANVGLRIGLDTIDGAAEGFVQPALQTIYQKGYVDPETGEYIEFDEDASFVDRYMGMWTQQGGWSAVAMNAAIAASMSSFGELGEFSLRKGKIITGLDDINKKITKNIELSSSEKGIIEYARKSLGMSENATIDEITKEASRVFKTLDYDKVNTKNMDLGTMKKLSDSIEGLDPSAQKEMVSVITGTKELSSVKNIAQLDDVMENYLKKLSLDDISKMDKSYKEVLSKYMDDYLKKNGFQIDSNKISTVEDLYKKYYDIMGLDDTLELPPITSQDYSVSDELTSPIAPKAKEKKIFEKSSYEISVEVQKEIDALDKTDPRYMEKVGYLRDKEKLLKELAKKVSESSSDGTTIKSIDLLSLQEQIKVKQAAQELYSIAASQENLITSSMKNLEDFDTSLAGLEYRFKSVESIEDKIARMVKYGYSIDDAKSEINDSLRYTLLVTGDYESTVLSKLKKLQSQGYNIEYVNNSWGKKTYQGLNVTLRNKDGLLVELQFHTIDSFNTKQVLNHDFYELSRNTSTSKEIKYISDKIQEINQKIYVGDETTFRYKTAYELSSAVQAFEPISEKFKSVYNKMRKHSMNIDEAETEMRSFYGDAGSKVTKMLRDQHKTIQEVYDNLNSTEKKAFLDFLNFTIEGKYLASLTDDELRAITRYTGGDYKIINNWLRTGNIPNHEKAYISTLNSALNKFGGTRGDTQLFRGTDIEAFTAQKQYANIFKGINTNDMDQVYSVLKSLEGCDFTDAGYMSTSPSYSHSFAKYNWANIILDIAAPDGTPGAYINQISEFYNLENEFLLAAGTKLKIISVEQPININGQRKIIVKCIVDS